MTILTLEHGRSAYWADFVAYGAASLGLLVMLVRWAPSGQALAEAGLVALGALLWTLMEYMIHRFLLHGLDPFKQWHAEHHRRPTALIGLPTVCSAALFAGTTFLPVLWMGQAWQACAVTLGVLLGYLAYCYAHHATHHWRVRTPWMLRLKRWHAIHHHAQEIDQCFGVTVPLWDHVFGSGPRNSSTGSGAGRRSRDLAQSIARVERSRPERG